MTMFARTEARFFDRLLASRRGRAFILGFMADAEDSDELGVFDTLVQRVDDPALQKMIRVHRDDEIRHAEVLRACIARGRVMPRPVPPELRVVPYFERALGDVGRRFLEARPSTSTNPRAQDAVMEAYVFLQVLEERAVVDFPRIAAALRPYDPESADVIDRIVRDEVRHVKYAKAISARYAASPARLAETLRLFRVAEARAREEHAQAFLSFALEADLVEMSAMERFFWKSIAALPSFAAPGFLGA